MNDHVNDKPSVTVLGLGQMGAALAGALLAAGHPTTVWNRTPARAKPLAARGRCTPPPSPGPWKRASWSWCVSWTMPPCASCSPRSPQPAARPGAGQPHDGFAGTGPRGGGSGPRKHGVGYLDGGITTTPPGVGDPANMVLYSGDPELLAAHHDTLAVLGDPVGLGADPGLASSTTRDCSA